MSAHRPARDRSRRTAGASRNGKRRPAGSSVQPDGATQLLEAVIEPGDRVAIEGDNQKQADFLAAALAKADPARVHDLHMVQSVLALPDHLAVFERGIANRLDFAFAGPQSRKLAELVATGALKIGAIHTYLELYARMLVDLTPRVALVVADKADRDGNLYTGPNTEDTPTIVEATAFRRRYRRGASQRDRRPPAPRRHPRRLGRFRRAEPQALRDRAAVHARPCEDPGTTKY